MWPAARSRVVTCAALSPRLLRCSRPAACAGRRFVRPGRLARGVVCQAASVPRWNPLGFSERNELFVGRVAMIGLVASLVGEWVSGKGPLAQLGYETGLPQYEVEPLLALLVAVAATSAFVPFHDQFIGETAPAALGLRYTASRQRLLGRLSMLAFFSSLILEAVTGSGPLDMLELDTGVPMNEVSAMLVFLLLLIGIGDLGLDEDSGQGAMASAVLAEAAASGRAVADDAADGVDWNADDGDTDDD